MQEAFLKYKKLLCDWVQAGVNCSAEKAEIIERAQSAREALEKEFKESNQMLTQKTTNKSQAIESEAQSTITRAKHANQSIRSRMHGTREYILQQGLGDLVPLGRTKHTRADDKSWKGPDIEGAFSQLDRLVAKTDRLADEIIELVRRYKRWITLSRIAIMVKLIIGATLLAGIIKLIKFLISFFH